MPAKKKRSIVQIYRVFIRILFFILLPGLYSSTFLGIKTIYQSLVQGNFDLSTNLYSLVEIIAIIPITIVLGRFFCGWMCAFGSVSDFLYSISKHVFKIKYKIPEKLDQVLKYFKYIWLVVLVILLWNVDWEFLSESNPWDAFGYLFTVKQVPDFTGAFEYFSFGLILLGFILLASLFVERFFCRYLCPLGAVFSLTSKLRILKIRKTRDKCGTCKICSNNCPMGIPMYQYDKIDSGECIQCLRCTAVCPRKNTTLTIGDTKVKSLVITTLAIALITLLYYGGNAVLGASGTSSDYASTETGKYLDGTYEGTGVGFRGETTVSVTVENGNITNVEVLSYEDDKQYFVRALTTIISEIIDAQATDVDTVSGATYSSNGIIAAVEDALTNAINPNYIETASSQDTSVTTTESTDTANIEDTATNNSTDTSENSTTNTADGTTPDPATTTGTDTTTNATTTDTTNNSGTSASTTETVTTPATDTQAAATTDSTTGTYIDGVYEGSGTGFRGTTTVSVTVVNGAISSIEVLSYQDDRPYFEYAFQTIVDNIIGTQSTTVDAVSGATYSSQGIMSAVQDALKNAIN